MGGTLLRRGEMRRLSRRQVSGLLVSLLCGLLLVGIHVASYVHVFWFQFDKHALTGQYMAAENGQFFLDWNHYGWAWFPHQLVRLRGGPILFLTFHRYGIELTVSFFALHPIWLTYPLVLLAKHARRRPSPGHCVRCGYNLTGNVSGVCPECGQPAER